jgi:hypothetical protein
MTTIFNKKILVFIIIVVLVFSGFSVPKQTQADIGDVVGVGLAVANCVGLLDSLSGFLSGLFSFGGEVPVKEGNARKKENCLDHLAWVAVNIAIEKASQSTVDWINGDTGGGRGPRYVQDVEGFLIEIADDTIGEYILGSSFAFVCDPFRLQLRASLAVNRRPLDRYAECSLTSTVNNIENFIGGDFRDGGWNAWGELVTRSNPYIQYMQAEAELEARIQTRQANELRKLQWGNGFLSWEVCPGEKYQCNFSGGILHGVNEDECRENGGSYQCAVRPHIATPGSVIEEQLNIVLASGQKRLQVADEFNEIVSALLNKLLNDLFSPGGLKDLKNTQKTKKRDTSKPQTGEDLCDSNGICPADPDDVPNPVDLPIPPGTTPEAIACIQACVVFCDTSEIGLACTPETNRELDICIKDCFVQFPPPPPPPPGSLSCGAAGGNRCAQPGDNSCAPYTPIDSSDCSAPGQVCCYDPTIGPPPPPPPTPGSGPPNEYQTVIDIANANPGALTNSCQGFGGSWQFMDLVVEALRSGDTRWGYNCKRGDCNDPSEDAISYYWGSGSPTNSSQVYIIDIIGGHCGPDPSPEWIDQTSATAAAGTIGRWLYPR